ncbi:unnamed protein product [Rangifer tarandus platyrhynchus]|uniref:Uncharacterized protein n=2 Tax=Rangifer tarandus platyrhynchus TaxID=3082113 RepID=A0ABN9A0U2_RANTA|nr:unnamed protein product [Rangifer tarandus platyrhynchus]
MFLPNKLNESVYHYFLRRANFCLLKQLLRHLVFNLELYNHCFLIKVISILHVFPITITFQVLGCCFKSSAVFALYSGGTFYHNCKQPIFCCLAAGSITNHFPGYRSVSTSEI